MSFRKSLSVFLAAGSRCHTCLKKSQLVPDFVPDFLSVSAYELSTDGWLSSCPPKLAPPEDRVEKLDDGFKGL